MPENNGSGTTCWDARFRIKTGWYTKKKTLRDWRLRRSGTSAGRTSPTNLPWHPPCTARHTRHPGDRSPHMFERNWRFWTIHRWYTPVLLDIAPRKKGGQINQKSLVMGNGFNMVRELAHKRGTTHEDTQLVDTWTTKETFRNHKLWQLTKSTALKRNENQHETEMPLYFRGIQTKPLNTRILPPHTHMLKIRRHILLQYNMLYARSKGTGIVCVSYSICTSCLGFIPTSGMVSNAKPALLPYPRFLWLWWIWEYAMRGVQAAAGLVSFVASVFAYCVL